jgi:uncharacterized protein GlcG (DUF336 family)
LKSRMREIMKTLDGIVLMAVGMGLASGAGLLAGCSSDAQAQTATTPGCAGLPTPAELTSVLKEVVHGDTNGGGGAEMWGGVVNRDGVVCSAAFSSADRDGSKSATRAIALAKASTAAGFSTTTGAVATGNLYANVQPGGPIFGLESGNPVDPAVAYGGDAASYGTANDPAIGKKIGGTITFGGGLALYDSTGKLVGGVGVSGDSSCADHIIAWEIRSALGLDKTPSNDNLTIGAGGHPDCGMGSAAIIAALPISYPIAP